MNPEPDPKQALNRRSDANEDKRRRRRTKTKTNEDANEDKRRQRRTTKTNDGGRHDEDDAEVVTNRAAGKMKNRETAETTDEDECVED